MPTLAQAIRFQWLRRIIWLIVILAVLYGIGLLTGPKVGAILEALTPPTLPDPPAVDEQVWRDDQNWTFKQADEFHFKSQNTRTLPVPLSWFLALEQPVGSPLGIPFSKRGRFAADDYLLRFGFIPAAKSANNPYGLPIGFATAPVQTIAGVVDRRTAIGFTCAACHTGQLVYAGKRYVIEGGPAVTDLGQLTAALGAALGQTALSEKLPIFNGRFERFARAVLKDQYSDGARNRLAAELDNVIKLLSGLPNGIDVTEGFTRLDALNRIGNQVFALDAQRFDNYVNINAPVNYPFIWTASWFSWVQYDGSIMQPLIRNAGEAMGVAAYTNFSAPPNEGRSSNAIPIANLHWIEEQLAGDTPPIENKRFTGLNAPTWPDSFPPIDQAKAADGARLYERHCKGCHLPALTRDVADGNAPDSDFWRYFRTITWYEDGEEKQSADEVLRVKIIPGKHIGTDPAQANVLIERRVNTAGRADLPAADMTSGMGIDIDVCAPQTKYPGMPAKPKLVNVHVSDGPVLLFALALGATVQQGINQWFNQNYLDEAGRNAYQGDRPNCLQAGAGYKARPLNGVWATAPFLHNGSVPTLMDLLSPVKDRPTAFLLGDPTFDPVKVGIVETPLVANGDDYDDDGYFILDTRKAGNHNSGHEFSDEKGEGVIGPALTQSEKEAIIEFLKTI